MPPKLETLIRRTWDKLWYFGVSDCPFCASQNAMHLAGEVGVCSDCEAELS